MTIVKLVKKEFLSIKRSLKMVLFVMVFPIFVIVFTPVHTFSSSLFSKDLSIAFFMFLPYLYAMTLMSDSILKERAQGTLDILLTSPIGLKKIIVAKTLPIPILGVLSQSLQMVALLIAEGYYKANIIPNQFIQLLLFMPLLAYLLTLVAMVVATKYNFEKTGEQALMVVIFLFSLGILALLTATNALTSPIITGLILIFMSILIPVVTHLSVGLTQYVDY